MNQKKDLKEMTLEELWQLFPIIIVPHRTEWKTLAAEEIELLAELLTEFSPVITHIGSTAIPKIPAKPIIDILVEVTDQEDFPSIRTIMENNGHICMSDSERRMSFNKGYTPEGFAEKVYHIHVRVAGDNDEISFRDYLRTHPATAYQYALLKQSLLPNYTHNRDGYTEAKSEFVQRITRLAKQKWK